MSNTFVKCSVSIGACVSSTSRKSGEQGMMLTTFSMSRSSVAGKSA
jgi:hypothetical protein